MRRDVPDPLPDGLTRRELLRRGGMGMGSLGLFGVLNDAGLLAGDAARAVSPRAVSPLAAKSPPLPARAKRVIHIFANGGPSHVDTFDPKPLLTKYAGKSLPGGNLQTERKTGAAFPSPFQFRKYGQSGIEVSELYPHVARSIDHIAVVRSMQADLPNHEPSLMLMNTGDNVMIRPSLGSWLLYGLGAENQNLPGFIALCPGGYPIKESENWRSAFLPGTYAGTFIDTKHEQIDKLIENIKSPHASSRQQREQLDLLRQLNEDHRRARPGDPQLEARIQSFELAYRMQSEAAEAFDVSREPKHVLAAYGSGVYARQILIARRLVERGVRMVQIWHGQGQPWDDHGDIMHHKQLAQESDQAIGALLVDLRQRGMLDDTLVIWGGEFGRTPVAELPQAKGRDHNPYGFSMWLAGGGVKGGTTYGATDDFGFKAVDRPVHVHDLHATILRLLGFDHKKLTYRYAGRDFRLTDVHGNVVHDLVA
jgi:hypothetical protein